MNQSHENHMSHRARMATAFAITMLEGTPAADNAAIVPTNTIRLSSAGVPEANGDYILSVEGQNPVYFGPNGHSLRTFYEAEPNGVWYVYNLFAVVLYACPRSTFPFGPWSSAFPESDPPPTATYV